MAIFDGSGAVRDVREDKAIGGWRSWLGLVATASAE